LLGSLMAISSRSAGRPLSAVVERALAQHRAVDTFTDAHRSCARARRVAPPHRRFAGIVVDMYYDHYLARHWRVR